MEFIHDRPSLGDIFCPPQQVLNEENDYSSRVSLLIIVRGSPTHETPQLVSSDIAIIHGGCPTDYFVTETNITPYLIICRNQQTRDAIVQGGLYTMPGTPIHFAVHEWQPRFGMSFDPPTYQVWVRIIGLPLQAWTTHEVTTILQKFSHPQQILPFGQQAGHYRHITALVATMHPSRIPLAYMYKESDYTTQIDIFLLTWRPWESSFFPPPDSPAPREGTSSPTQHQNDHMTPLNYSSSSSNAPSEPSIDYSSWSSRSYQVSLCFTQN